MRADRYRYDRTSSSSCEYVPSGTSLSSRLVGLLEREGTRPDPADTASDEKYLLVVLQDPGQ